jgi:tRNA threonylcarbamoyl adenosine modification protein (Sua5/YciO/YrdC/YwlC family)
MILSINSENPQLRLIKKAVEVLKEGGIIVYPTDTVYGMGCDLFNKQAIERIYEIKRRNKKEPLSFICADLKDISNYALVSNYAYKTMRRLLPGAYTFVLEASRQVPKILLTKRRTVGIRVPDNKICLALVGELGHPLINTSAKLEQDEVLSDPFEIEKKFKKLVDLVIDGGPLASDQSSVIDMIDDVPTVLRPGKGDVSDFL